MDSLAELSELARRDMSELDPHRPYVDEVTLPCPECGGEARRVPEVIDAWYDSGSMPFARLGAPWHDQEQFLESYPAQFICEAIHQTRGWFYSLMAVGTWRSAGHPTRKWSASAWWWTDRPEDEQAPRQRAGAPPADGGTRRGRGPLVLRRVRLPLAPPGGSATRPWTRSSARLPLTYWHTASFLVLYANAAAEQGRAAPGAARRRPPPSARPLLDRWLLSELHATTSEVTAHLESFDTAAAGLRLAAFIDDLSNWYVRRSRRRFWDGPGRPDGNAAFATLYESLHVLTRLMAPITPFLTDHVWSALRGPDDPESVHLTSWPAADSALIDADLSAQMALTRLWWNWPVGPVGRLGPGRQPLPRAVVSAPGFDGLAPELRAEIAQELDVRSLELMAAVSGHRVDYVVEPELPGPGPPVRQGHLGPSPAGDRRRGIRPGWRPYCAGKGGISVVVDGTPVGLMVDEVMVMYMVRAGWTVAADAGWTPAIEATITLELRPRGTGPGRHPADPGRAWKNDGLYVSDRIRVRWETPDPELAAALTEHGALIAAETLADDFGPGSRASSPTDGSGRAAHQHADADLGLAFWLARA